jgi:hypothetical protein
MVNEIFEAKKSIPRLNKFISSKFNEKQNKYKAYF